MKILKSMIGKKFHRLLVKEHAGKIGTKQHHYKCLCDCGKEVVVMGCNLRLGHTKSCGCLRFNDLTGKKLGRLTVIKFFSKAGKQRRYLCLCDCGKETIVQGNQLGKKNGVRSCGCLRKDKLPPGQSIFNSLFGGYKRTAEKRNYSFELDKDEFKALTKLNCQYCGASPSNVHKLKQCKGTYEYNGIDRVDNGLGYNAKNCVSCCGICNRMKNTMARDKFLNHLKKILKFVGVEESLT